MPRRPPRPRACTSATPRKILSYCLHQLGSREEAEDAVQTTFMNAFRALGRGVVPEAESAWLFKIAENVCLSRRRSSWRRGRIESPSDFDVIEEVVPGPSRQRDELIGIEDALASMPEQQRRAILLREWQGLSYREISEELELSQSAVETLIFRARRSLAQGLEQPDLIKKPKRKGLRRALRMIDVGTLAAAAKTLLVGSVAVKATATAVAVTAAVTAASVTPKLEGHSPKPTQAPAHVAPSASQPAAVGATAFGPSAAAAHEDAAGRQVTSTRPSAPEKLVTTQRPDQTFRAATPRRFRRLLRPPRRRTLPRPRPPEPAMPTAAPAEPAQQPAADQPIVAPAPAAQPGHDVPKPVVPVHDETPVVSSPPAPTQPGHDAPTPAVTVPDEVTSTPRTGHEPPVVPSPTVPTAPVIVPSPSELTPAPGAHRRPDRHCHHAGAGTAPSSGSLFGGS